MQGAHKIGAAFCGPIELQASNFTDIRFVSSLGLGFGHSVGSTKSDRPHGKEFEAWLFHSLLVVCKFYVVRSSQWRSLNTIGAQTIALHNFIVRIHFPDYVVFLALQNWVRIVFRVMQCLALLRSIPCGHQITCHYITY